MLRSVPLASTSWLLLFKPCQLYSEPRLFLFHQTERRTLTKLIYAKYHCPVAFPLLHQLLLLLASEWASLFTECFTIQAFLLCFALLCPIFHFFWYSPLRRAPVFDPKSRNVSTQVRTHFHMVEYDWMCGVELSLSSQWWATCLDLTDAKPAMLWAPSIWNCLT